MSRSHSSSKCGRDCGVCPDRGESRRVREHARHAIEDREIPYVEDEMQTDAAMARADEQARLSPHCDPECMRWKLCWPCRLQHAHIDGKAVVCDGWGKGSRT